MTDPLAPQADDRIVHRVEGIISNLLRVGVFLSLGLIVAGTLVSFLHSGRYGSTHADLDRLISSTGDFPHTVGWFITGLRELRGQALIVLGLVVLIATPALRVAVSIIAFAVQRDWAFVMITALVLALLGTSLALGNK